MMDDLRSYEGHAASFDADEGGAEAPPLVIGTDERRMHVRAYNYWISLLNGRPFPSIHDLDPASLGDFGSHGVLLDFSTEPKNPAIPFLGSSLEVECAIGHPITTIADVPSRSLLSRLTDHYLQIIANRAPIGFEAEFVSQRGHNTLYRGILMPFSSDGETIDFLYGVINWKELADDQTAAQLMLAIDRELRPKGGEASTSLWADGPGASRELPPAGAAALTFGEDEEGLADRLAAAREGADLFRQNDGRGRAALYRALGLAYDFALLAAERREDYVELLEDAGLREQTRAPMTPIVKLVFGADYDKSRLTEFAAVLSHATRHALPAGALAAAIEREPGGMKALVAAERRARRPEPRRDLVERAFDALRRAPAQASLSLPSGSEEFVLLIARREPGGALQVLAPVPSDRALLERAVRQVVR